MSPYRPSHPPRTPSPPEPPGTTTSASCSTVSSSTPGGANPDAGRRRLPPGLGSVLDLHRIGAYGHSAGGLSSFDLLVGDPRIRAAIDLDGELGYGYDDPAFFDQHLRHRPAPAIWRRALPETAFIA